MNLFEIPYFRKVENYNNINAILETVLELGVNFLQPLYPYVTIRDKKSLARSQFVVL